MDQWGEDEYVEKNVVTMMDTTYIHREPVGVCLVMGAWNYPVQLSLQPVTGAIASGAWPMSSLLKKIARAFLNSKNVCSKAHKLLFETFNASKGRNL